MGREKAVSRELTALRARVAEWRKRGGGRGSRIPEDLWQEAVSVARVEGLYATARATCINYERLKERSATAQGWVTDNRAGGESGGGHTDGPLVAARHGGVKCVAGAGAGELGTEGSRFIAVQMRPPRTGQQTTIELVGRHGERMRVEVTSCDVDVASVLETFWSRPS